MFGTRKTGRHPRAAETREDLQMAAAQEKRWVSVSTLVILVSCYGILVSCYLGILVSVSTLVIFLLLLRSMQKGGWMDHPYLCLSPVFTIGVAVAFKLANI